MTETTEEDDVQGKWLNDFDDGYENDFLDGEDPEPMTSLPESKESRRAEDVIPGVIERNDSFPNDDEDDIQDAIHETKINIMKRKVEEVDGVIFR